MMGLIDLAEVLIDKANYKIQIEDRNFLKNYSGLHSNSFLILSIPDRGIKMEVHPSYAKEKYNIVHMVITYFEGNRQISTYSISPEILSVLVVAYHNYISNFTRHQISAFPISVSKLLNFFGSIASTNLWDKVMELSLQYKDLRSVRTLSVLKGFNGTTDAIIGKTIIELDADIVTLIPLELIHSHIKEYLLNLHLANTLIANYFFLFPLLRIFRAIKTLRNVLSLIPASLIFFICLFFTNPSSLQELPLDFLLSAVPSAVGFGIAKKYISKVIGAIIRKKLMVE